MHSHWVWTCGCVALEPAGEFEVEHVDACHVAVRLVRKPDAKAQEDQGGAGAAAQQQEGT